MDCSHLNMLLPVAPDGAPDPWARVLAHLGDDTTAIVRRLNLRPTHVSRLHNHPYHILIRLSTPDAHYILRIAPDRDLTNEVLFARTIAQHHMPGARLVLHDLTRSTMPYDYLIEGHIGGEQGDTLLTAAQQSPSERITSDLYDVARQTGVLLRQLHRITMPGWGRPTRSGRWLTPDWTTVLLLQHNQHAPDVVAAQLFDPDERAVMHDLLHHICWDDVQPRLLHGAVSPHTVRFTRGEVCRVAALTDPGAIIAGDPLFDVAWGMHPTYPRAWQQGLLAGYTTTMPLAPPERHRLDMLTVIAAYWHTCHAYSLGQPHQPARDETLRRLHAYLALSPTR